jgi:hypothetical protein
MSCNRMPSLGAFLVPGALGSSPLFQVTELWEYCYLNARKNLLCFDLHSILIIAFIRKILNLYLAFLARSHRNIFLSTTNLPILSEVEI